MDAGGPSGEDGAALAATLEQIVRSTVPMLDVMGVEVVAAGPGHVRTRLPFKTENGNHVGSVYAGALFSFLESIGGALVFVSLDISRYIPVVVEGTIRYMRMVTGAIECDVRLTEEERDALHAALDADPKYRWTLSSQAVAEDGRIACEADFVYRFRTTG